MLFFWLFFGRSCQFLTDSPLPGSIFKLAQGEYIAPEKIEIVYQKHELVAQAFVYGDSLQATLVGVVVPDEDVIKMWASENGLGGKSFAELCKDESVKKHFLKTLVDYGKKDGLKGFENIKALYLDNEAFTVENNLLTPTFKLKVFMNPPLLPPVS